MKLLDMFKDDVTKQWSLSRVSAFMVVVFNIAYCGYTVWVGDTFPDLGNNWLVLVLTLYGLNKGATVARAIKIGGNSVDMQ